MSNLTVSNNKQLPVPMPPEMLPLNGALEVFQTALNAGVAIYAKAEDAKTQRALILAEKEIQALSIKAETQKAMHREDLLHESRMKILHIVERLLVEHAESLTPDILSATQLYQHIPSASVCGRRANPEPNPEPAGTPMREAYQ